jgi:hypothetical protein
LPSTTAFDKAVISDPPFETVVHTASPFTFRVTDIKKDLLVPGELSCLSKDGRRIGTPTKHIHSAVNGTVGLLQAIKRSAPTVKRVVITSSFAAIIDPSKPADFVFSEVRSDDPEGSGYPL